MGPEAFAEVRFLAHYKQLEALDLISEQAAEFRELFARDSGGLLKSFDAEAKKSVVVTMGSVIGSMNSVLADMRAEGTSIGALSIRSYRPFPSEALRAALADAERVIVFEKSLAVGIGGFTSGVTYTTLSGHFIDTGNPGHVWYVLAAHLILAIVVMMVFRRLAGDFTEQEE